MSIPDAPWVGKCREDYYGYKEDLAYCEYCGCEYDRSEMEEVNGDLYCKECYNICFGDEEDEDASSL